jgi:hypothetical protein
MKQINKDEYAFVKAQAKKVLVCILALIFIAGCAFIYFKIKGV